MNNKIAVCIILMCWIFLGNFILLNLFLAILLDAFLEDPQSMTNHLALGFNLEQRREARSKNGGTSPLPKWI